MIHQRRPWLAVAGLIAATLFAPLAGAASSPNDPGYWQYPAIAHYGKIHPRPDAAERPSRDQAHKLVFDISQASGQPDEINPGLNTVARAINLYASAGVPLNKLQFVAVVHGGATPAVLDNAHYKTRLGQDNPNVALIAALKKAGVKIEVCGQALSHHGFADASVNTDVTITLAALVDIAHYQHLGYAYIGG